MCWRMLSIISRHFKQNVNLLIDNSEAKTKPNEADVWRSRAQHFAKVPQNARVFQFLFVLSFVAAGGGGHQVNSHIYLLVSFSRSCGTQQVLNNSNANKQFHSIEQTKPDLKNKNKSNKLNKNLKIVYNNNKKEHKIKLQLKLS